MAAATTAGIPGAIALGAVGIGFVTWGAWPDVQNHKWLWKAVDSALVPALLAIPFFSIFPLPPAWLAPGWLVLWAVCSVIVALQRLGRGTVRGSIDPGSPFLPSADTPMAKALLESEQGALKEHVKELVKHLDSVSAKLNNVRAERDAYLAERNGAVELARYGAQLTAMPAMTDNQRDALRQHLQELQHAMEEAFAKQEVVWQDVLGLARTRPNGGADGPLATLARMAQEVTRLQLGRADALYREKLHQGGDARPALVRLYVLYGEWGIWILRIGKMVGFETGFGGGYKDWYAADARFEDAFRSKLKISELHPVRRAVGEGTRLPTPGASL